MHALKTTLQKPAVPLPRGDRLVLSTADGRHHDEAGKLVGLCSQTVEQPGTHARPAADRRAGIHERVSRVVVNRLGLQRADDAQLIGDRAQVWEDRRCFVAGLAPFFERVLRGEARQLLALQLSDRLPLREGIGHRLAAHFDQLRLMVERLQVRHSTGHHEEDHSLCLGLKVRLVDDAGPAIDFCFRCRR